MSGAMFFVSPPKEFGQDVMRKQLPGSQIFASKGVPELGPSLKPCWKGMGKITVARGNWPGQLRRHLFFHCLSKRL